MDHTATGYSPLPSIFPFMPSGQNQFADILQDDEIQHEYSRKEAVSMLESAIKLFCFVVVFVVQICME
jgi:hypothetical protein